MSEGAEPRAYSRAFENFVKTDGDQADVVGLIAYALFKQAIREDAVNGAPATGEQRNPSNTTVKTYRAAAEQVLTGVVSRAIDEATPEIQQTGTYIAIEAAQASIEAHISRRTSFGPALLTNIVAWLVTLAIAALILILAARPGVEQTLAQAVSKIGKGTASSSETTK